MRHGNFTLNGLDEMKRFDDNPMFLKIRSLKILQFLKEGDGSPHLEVEFTNPVVKMEGLLTLIYSRLKCLTTREKGPLPTSSGVDLGIQSTRSELPEGTPLLPLRDRGLAGADYISWKHETD